MIEVRRAKWIESLWFFDVWWRLNWRYANARTLGEPFTRAWSA